MGLLNFLSRSESPSMVPLPSGSFTVDRSGRTVVSTLPSSFPKELMDDIAKQVLATFSDSKEIQLALNELVIHYPSLKIIARELRGGALIFMVPINQASATTLFKRL